MMRIDIMTLFSDTVGDVLSESIIGRAQERDLVRIECHQIRDYTVNKQRQVDDYPYGGGHGAIMQADPLWRCWSHICDEAGQRVHTIYMSPCGKVYNQQEAKRLAYGYDRLILVCGHYEGVDQRFIDECVDEEISLGDFVLTGGEIAAMAVADSVCRLLPGVLGDEECFTEESHWDGLLEYPQYSRPEEWHGRKVPPVLLSGDHAKVADWRKKESYKRTLSRRPDILHLENISKKERKLFKQAEDELRGAEGEPEGAENGKNTP
jgi:tRNA (guanine37-N1)-methyltransferase